MSLKDTALLEDIASRVANEYAAAVQLDTTIQEERQEGLKRYEGKPYGDEVDGKSKVITREVFETVEALLPQLVDVFVSAEPVCFVPESQDDIEPAKQETSYVNHVFMNENNGFMLTSTWLKDAIMQKNGVVEAYWDKRVREEQETYEDIPYIQFLLMQEEAEQNPDKLKIVSATTSVMSDDPLAMMNATVNVDIIRTKNNSRIVVENVAPEDFIVARDHNSVDLKECRYSARISRPSVADLLDIEGIDKAAVKSLPPFQNENESEERTERYEDENPETIQQPEDNSRIVEVITHYIMADFDDGVKLWRVITGSGSAVKKILLKEVCDRNPFHSGVIINQAHKYNGMSIPDVINDIQRINTILMRQALDNVYLTNGPTRIVNTALITNPSQLADNVPFQVVAASGDPNMAVKDLTVPFVANNVFTFFETTKIATERRTGVSDQNQGLDPDSLADSTNMVGGMIMNAALQRIKFYARTFAETGFKSLMLHIHELARKYESTDKMFQINGEFQPINPRSWRQRDDMQAKVGLGYSEKRERVANLMNIITQQKEIYLAAQGPGPLVNEKNIYDALVDLGNASEFSEVTKYFSNPAEYVAPPKEDPNAGALQVLREQIMGDLEQTKAKINADMAKNTEKLAQERYEFEQEMKLQRDKLDEEVKLKYEQMILEYGKTAASLKPVEAKSE